MNEAVKINLNGIDAYDDTRYELDSRFVFSKEEFEKIRQGYARRSSYDYRWYIECKDDCVYILRSWNPFVVFKTQFEKAGDSYISSKTMSVFEAKSENKKVSDTSIQNYRNFWIYSLISQLIFNEPQLMVFDNLAFRSKIDFNGLHGFSHWRSIFRTGTQLSHNIDRTVLFYFSVFHDFFRENEYHDSGHGKRALLVIPNIQAYMREAHFDKIQIDSVISKLSFALEHHDLPPEEFEALDNSLKNDDTVRFCIDSDRLDLGRVGIRPESRFLLTEEARSYNDSR
jgi:uncharacterized protein